MADINEILARLEAGDPLAADQLFPLVYDELRRIAAREMARELPGHTLQATALVHESYLRLAGIAGSEPWQTKGHFFAAAGRAMRQILVDWARRKNADMRGGQLQRIDLVEQLTVDTGRPADFLALDEALTQLEQHSPDAAKLVELRYFSGLTHQEAAEALNIGRRAADRLWALARAWLFRRMTRA